MNAHVLGAFRRQAFAVGLGQGQVDELGHQLPIEAFIDAGDDAAQAFLAFFHIAPPHLRIPFCGRHVPFDVFEISEGLPDIGTGDAGFFQVLPKLRPATATSMAAAAIAAHGFLPRTRRSTRTSYGSRFVCNFDRFSPWRAARRPRRS